MYLRHLWYLQKAASLSAGEITDAQLAKINKYAMEPLTAEKYVRRVKKVQKINDEHCVPVK